MATWLVRKSGSNNNGGTSQSVLATGTDGVTNGTNTITATSAPFLVGMVGQGIAINVNGGGFVYRTVATFNSSSSITFSGATIAAHSGQTYNVGGSWLTVNQALVTTNSLAAGDSIYVGAGVYRETVAVAKSGSSTATGTNGVTSTNGTTFTDSTANGFTSGMVGQNIEIVAGNSSYLCNITAFSSSSVVTIAPATAMGFPTAAFSSCTWIVGKIAVIGDVDGAVTGDAGQVTLSAYTTNDKTGPSATVLLAYAAQNYLAFSVITFVAGDANLMTIAAGGGNISWIDCSMSAVYASGAAMGNFASSTTGLPLGLTFERCNILSNLVAALRFNLATTTSGSADWDALVTIRNCIIVSGAITSSNNILITGTGANAHLGGGIRVYNSTLWGSTTGMNSQTASELSTSIPSEIHNSVVMAGTNCLAAGTSGQLIEDHNLLYSSTPRSNVTAGTGSISNGTYAALLELGQSQKWAAGTIRQMFAPDGAGSPLLGFGSGSVSVQADWFGRPRPSGGAASVNAVGAFEFHDYAIQNAASVPAGNSYSGQLIGPGDAYLQIPVDAVSASISVQVAMSANYGGTNYAAAILLANGELGVVSQNITCSSSLETFQTLTFNAITPTKQGWVTLQIVSYDQLGTASVYFGAVT